MVRGNLGLWPLKDRSNVQSTLIYKKSTVQRVSEMIPKQNTNSNPFPLTHSPLEKATAVWKLRNNRTDHKVDKGGGGVIGKIIIGFPLTWVPQKRCVLQQCHSNTTQFYLPINIHNLLVYSGYSLLYNSVIE